MPGAARGSRRRRCALSNRFAQRVFFWAGAYGIVALAPQYLLESRIGIDYPPAISHPEYFYGFLGCGLAWQFAFIAISRDPVGMRSIMPACVAEKWLFAIAAAVLFAQARIPGVIAGFACIDFILGCLFLVAYFQCRKTASQLSAPAAPIS